MTPAYLLFGILIVLVLLGAATYFGWRQLCTAKLLAFQRDIPEDERIFLRGQVRRRLICCLLMVLLAILLAGWFVIEAQLPEHLPNNPGEQPRDNPWVGIILYYWSFLLLVLFALLILGGVDLIATARFGLRSHRKLVSEHRAELEAEISRLTQMRHERNGD